MSAVTIAALEALDVHHRDALVVLALDCERAASRTRWQERTARALVVDGADGADVHSQPAERVPFKAVVDRVVAEGAAIVTPNQLHRLASPWLVPLLADAHRRRALQPIASQLGASDRYSYFGDATAKSAFLVALVSGNDVPAAQAGIRAYLSRSRTSETILDILGFDVPRAWVEQLDADLRIEYLKAACHGSFVHLARLGPDVRIVAASSSDAEVRARMATLHSLAGEVQDARAILERAGASQWERGALAFAALTEGRIDEARELFVRAAVGSRKQRIELPAYLAVFDLLLTAASDEAADVADLPKRLERARRSLPDLAGAHRALDEIIKFRQTGRIPTALLDGFSWLETMTGALRDAWTGVEGSARDRLAPFVVLARENGYAWLANELERIVARRESSSLLALLGKKESWELALDALVSASGAAAPPSPQGSGEETSELWWTIDVIPLARWMELEAHVVSKRAAKGKKISIVRALADGAHPLGEHDRRIVEAYSASRNEYGYSGVALSLLVTLVGHPRVRDTQGRHVRISLAEPTLHVTPSAGGALIRFVPSSFDASGVAFERVGDDEIVVYKRNAVAARILEILKDGSLHVPSKGLPRITELLGSLGAVIPVQAASSLARDGGQADSRLRVQLFRAGNGLRVRVRVTPGGDGGSSLRPGQPPLEAMVSTPEGLVRLTRDLAGEARLQLALLGECPTLASLPNDGDDRVASDLETCLELLLELRRQEPNVVVEWLEGQALRAPSIRGASNVRIRALANKECLILEGELVVDESRVLEMRELLSAASRAVGRFVPIGNDEYVALTDELRKKVEALGRLHELGKNGRLSTALLPAIDGVLSGLDVTFAAQLEKKRDAFDRARTLEIKTPRDLATELRDYQREGFLFLARRAEAGVGACLADDMGLGKTVQALALLLHRRKKGPALVVAPTSVCRNWENEARRFAPSLTVHRLAEGDRAACVADAARGDVVVASYGLLASETELLASRTWATVIYDEAHALKNAHTRRWAAARDIKGEAVVALSGTPVENHAGELHALFDLLVPGMLGKRSVFDSTFGKNVANGDREAAALLRQLVRPFVLRRTKGQVLTELPPKTEVLQVVPASDEHGAFYEAVRERALEKIERARKVGGPQAARIRIELLAEITRLRRAAIDPRLVGGADAPEGSKLDALTTLVLELREEGRRALVFSQFLEVLDLARERLEERGIECRRLDGTMTQGARADEVAAFQGGQGDVFLVSLKAGGVGMNMTGADVVILLDPWWNPAVEDQAASRSHRMGQSRPVTVVRIVTEGTIEEKVLALHEKKRQLFDDVVTDADGGGALDMETLAALIA